MRWVQPGGIHLTLKFLGQTPIGQIGAIDEALRLAYAGIPCFSCSAGELGCFPDPRRPRVVWVGVQERTGALSRLQSVTEDACVGLGFRRERRAFHAHLTLGRLRDRASARERRSVGELVEGAETGSLATVTATAISLIHSDLQPGGAVYTTLREIELEEG